MEVALKISIPKLMCITGKKWKECVDVQGTMWRSKKKPTPIASFRC